MNRPLKDTGVKVTLDFLLDYKDRLNEQNFSREMGWLWTVATLERADGSKHHILNRVDRKPQVHGEDRPRQRAFDGVSDKVQTEARSYAG
jgi:hypothetical protein